VTRNAAVEKPLDGGADRCPVLGAVRRQKATRHELFRSIDGDHDRHHDVAVQGARTVSALTLGGSTAAGGISRRRHQWQLLATGIFPVFVKEFANAEAAKSSGRLELVGLPGANPEIEYLREKPGFWSPGKSRRRKNSLRGTHRGWRSLKS